jgi:NAD(P)-dependent dehydrogenase (short-subunit alcohol dehydrogenase family)
MRKTAIVTGASRGIGRAIALCLAADGFGVIVNFAGNKAKAEEVVSEITSAGGRALAIQANVANPEDVKQIFEKTLKAFRQIDVVVNNAGIMPLSPIAKGDVETFDKGIATNLRGTSRRRRSTSPRAAVSSPSPAASSPGDSPPTAPTSPRKQVSKASSTSSQMSFADTR